MLFERVLLTNDDGIDAPGLLVLERVAAVLAREVWVVAPSRDRSGVSHALSFHAEIALAGHGPRRFAVDGTPGDCVVMGVRHILRDTPPDLVLSGINRGSNIGRETVFSGTVGAAMTGLLLGVPSIALSQSFRHPDLVRWETAEALASDTIAALAAPDVLALWRDCACLNVNFPNCAPERAGLPTLAQQGPGLLGGFDMEAVQDAPHRFRLKPFRSVQVDQAGSEAAVLAAHGIAVTPLRFERTDEACFGRLLDVLPGV
ncbi:5'/3'-nucleotidase SurE [Acetobacteraceae bacterium KSS8]|uniref:5'-nucleotidase SurE n=1 Tax=Endosaccharibacter trunci TaxID=2812733 RepID=A0ABT1W7P2_9PROT|nr:5'/3'-nucleotidase SurE [Acetobacteraceae bacterium KSS8]